MRGCVGIAHAPSPGTDATGCQGAGAGRCVAYVDTGAPAPDTIGGTQANSDIGYVCLRNNHAGGGADGTDGDQGKCPLLHPAAPYYPVPQGNILPLGVMYSEHGVSLWADMNAATPPGSRCCSALCAGDGDGGGDGGGCAFVVGDGAGASEQYLGKADTASACVALVRRLHPSADGVTWGVADKARKTAVLMESSPKRAVSLMSSTKRSLPPDFVTQAIVLRQSSCRYGGTKRGVTVDG